MDNKSNLLNMQKKIHELDSLLLNLLAERHHLATNIADAKLKNKGYIFMLLNDYSLNLSAFY